MKLIISISLVPTIHIQIWTSCYISYESKFHITELFMTQNAACLCISVSVRAYLHCPEAHSQVWDLCRWFSFGAGAPNHWWSGQRSNRLAAHEIPGCSHPHCRCGTSDGIKETHFKHKDIKESNVGLWSCVRMWSYLRSPPFMMVMTKQRSVLVW